MKKILQKATIMLSTILMCKTASAQVTTQTLSYTGSSQMFTAPSCIQATITCYGGNGSNGVSTASGAIGGNGGAGAMAQGVISLTAGQVLNIYVGGMGTGTMGGFNGGGNGGSTAGAGGGASDIRLNGTALLNRVLIAGGGGGGGNAGCASATVSGGNGGAGGGGNGTAGFNSVAGGGGQGGNGTNGGAAGIGCPLASGTVGVNGTLGQGGQGGNGVNICGALTSGGGGGGGYTGGGGGGGGTAGTNSCTLNDTGGGGGGAGGTNYFATSITSTVSTQGVNNGNGYVVISYSVLPSPTISVNSGVITSGQSFTMTPTGASTYTFSSGSAVVSPTTSTTYTVVGTSATGCLSSNTATSVVTVIPACSIADQSINTPTPASICGSGSSTITLANSETGVFYFLRDNTTNSIVDGPISGNSSNISFNTGMINSTSSYNVNAIKDYGIALPTSNDIVRYSSPFYMYANQITVESWVYSQGGEQPWAGQSSIAADNMATNVWLWHAGIFYVNNNGNWISLVFPTMPSGWTHVASVANASGMYIYYNGALVASNSSGITSGIRNNSSSVIDLGQDPRFAVGTSGRNSSTGFDNFRVWNTARTSIEIANNMTNCNLSNPNLVLNSNFYEGSGTSILSLTGPQGQLINPTTNWVLGSRACPNCEFQLSQTATVTVNPLPTVSVNSGTICAGQSFTMMPSGADTYSYSGGSDLVMPTSDASYTVTGTDANGCSNTAVSSVTVNPLPIITSQSGNATLCGDVSSTHSVSVAGTNTYEWYYTQIGGTDEAMIDGSYTEINYTTNVMTIQQVLTGDYDGYGVYCVITNSNNCSTTSMIDTIVANPLPNVLVNSGAICAGQSFTMVPSGANTYTYSGGSAVVMPSADASYTVTGTDANGCENTAVSTITVNALPSLMTMTTNTLLCTGETATLSVMGASTYTWSTTENTPDIVVTPTVQTTYTVDGTDANGCMNTTTITQDVSLCTGVAGLTNNTAVNVYPNPNNGLFVIELTTTSKVTVTNALGQVVIAETFDAGKHDVNIHHEATGVYFVKVIENNKQQIIKMVKE